ncbi:MAG TPA: methyltransferase [Nocardioides sp.]|nr:methyltransferase [Nocardioides sp.]
MTVPAPAVARPLRAALAAADYTVDGVEALLGETAHAALRRSETAPALRRTTDGSPLATLVRLFLLQTTVTRSDAERALPHLVDPLAGAGLLVDSAGEVRAALDCRPYADDGRDWWVVSDLTPGLDGQPVRVGSDHVLGVTPASTSLAQLTNRSPVGRALDLGAGCGVQSLHLATHADHVVATDVNPRALAMTTFNAALNDVDVEVREGSLWEPVDGGRFGLIAANPPFVISPPTDGQDDRLVYRDSGLPGDQVVERVVRGAAPRLTDGGWCHVVANWAIREGRPWEDRVGAWLAPDCDALVVQREVLDPPSYVELWLKDAGRHGGPGYLEAYDAWLRWFGEERIEGIGFGWVNLRRRAITDGVHELLDHPYAVEQPVASAVVDWATAQHVAVDETTRLTLPVGVVQETHGDPGAQDPETIVLRQRRGLCRACQVDTVEAALAGACDGELTVGQILDALALLLDRDRDDLVAAYLPATRRLVADGFLTPM